MKQGGRFTAWFSDTERLALERKAKDDDATINYIIRRAVRKYIGTEALKAAAESVMVVPGNGDEPTDTS